MMSSTHANIFIIKTTLDRLYLFYIFVDRSSMSTCVFGRLENKKKCLISKIKMKFQRFESSVYNVGLDDM